MQSSAYGPRAGVIHAFVPAQLLWYGAGVVLAFLTPYLFTSALDLNHDLYYGVYFAVVAAFLFAYAALTKPDMAALIRGNWRWSLALGIVVAAALVIRVVTAEDSTPRPGGAYLVFSVAWRGVLYGVVDALLLTAFPLAVAHQLFGGRLVGLTRRIAFGALVLALVMVITATYHLGYRQFREDGVTAPETGNVIISLPAVLTANPLGSIVAHGSMHVAAVIHAYETDVYLPPQTFVDGKSVQPPGEVQLSEGDTGRRVDLAVGGTLIVALPSNPSTGYAWAIVEPLPGPLRQEGEPRFVPAGSTQPIAGAGGTTVFTFVASEAGLATLNLAYLRSFEDAPPEKTFSVQVEVR